MKKRTVSTLLWCVICLLVISLFLPAIIIDHANRMDNTRQVMVSLFINWEVGYGESSPGPDGWTPFDSAARSELASYKGKVWLKRELPELKWRSPYLIFSRMSRFEVFVDDQPFYSFNMDGTLKYINHNSMMHPVPISPQDFGKTLLVIAQWDKQNMFGDDWVLAGELDQALYTSIRIESALFIYSIIGIIAGAAGIAMLIRRKEALYSWFSFFMLSMGFGMLLSCRSLQWFFDIAALYYWGILFIPLTIWACIGFYATVLNVARSPLVRIMHALMASYMALCVSAALWMPSLYWKLWNMGSPVVAVAGFAAITYTLLRYRTKESQDRAKLPLQGDVQEQIWLIRGYWIFTICTIVNLIMQIWPVLMSDMIGTNEYLYRMIEGLMPNGMLLFIISMVMVLISRVRRVYSEAERNAADLLESNKELEQFHRNLEQLVETRTAELERANRSLAVTLREKAETLAEVSVLEERGRIAHEMHDVVGHTLTAAIVQLEATKKLADREDRIPMEKLDLLSELVRKGLDDIRKAVRLMKSDEEQTLPLEAALQELIQYTEDTMEIKIWADISIPSHMKFGRLTEQVLYHALQEGLTNAIRHGQCARARFILRAVNDSLQFRLVSDGLPFGAAVPGFGLTSMMERVELLGGSVTIESSADVFGSPIGCELAIDLPLS